MSAAIATMRDAIVTAVAGLTGVEGVADVSAAATVNDCWALARRKPAILVVYAGLQQNAPTPMGNRLFTACNLDWYIVVVSSNARTPTAAFSEAGGADSLVEALRAIRDTQIGATSTYLRLIGEQILTPADRAETGGPVAYVCHYRTSQMSV